MEDSQRVYVNVTLNEYINLTYFKTLLENSAVTKSDLTGKIIYANENFCKITGYTKDELIGKNHNIFKHPENDPKVFKSLWESIKAGKVWQERLLSVNKDGSDFWAETTIIPLIDKEGLKPIEYIAIRRDITDFLKLKREANAQKIKAKEAKEISKAKDAFLILFTHELKTPLNAIINFSKYLLKHANHIENMPKGKLAVLLERIENSAKDMLLNVTDLLDLSKLRVNKLIYNKSSFGACNAVHSVIEELEGISNAKGVKIKTENLCKKSAESSSHRLVTDEFRFKQVVRNILSNAIKYSNGKVLVSMLEKGEFWELHIEDNGPGIENSEGIFDLFEREHGKSQHEGTGVGLTFVKYLCKDLGFSYHLDRSKALGGLDFIISQKRS